MNNWHTVYDFADRFPKSGLMTSIIMLLFVAAGICIYRYHKLSDNEDYTPIFGSKRQYGMFIGIAFTCISGLISLITIPNMIIGYYEARVIYDTKKYHTIEGRVIDFDPMPETGHKNETFTVSGVPFAFSDFEVSDYGYNNAASHGGAIKQDLKVRICYFNSGGRNIILKLETAANQNNTQ
jgi:hypothetical protein